MTKPNAPSQDAFDVQNLAQIAKLEGQIKVLEPLQQAANGPGKDSFTRQIRSLRQNQLILIRQMKGNVAGQVFGEYADSEFGERFKAGMVSLLAIDADQKAKAREKQQQADARATAEAGKTELSTLQEIQEAIRNLQSKDSPMGRMMHPQDEKEAGSQTSESGGTGDPRTKASTTKPPTK